jgi:hypothetical protein
MIRYLSKLDPLRLELIAPERCPVDPAFTRVSTDHRAYRRRLDELQRFRGGVYVDEGFLRRQDLDTTGRHYSALDRRRWHLLVVNAADDIKACVSLRFYSKVPDVERLTLHEVLHRSTGGRLAMYQRAVRQLMDESADKGLTFGEVGGWAVSPDVRNGAATVATILAAWSLPRIFGCGESLWVATVGKGKRAERILSRMGGFRLCDAQRPLPSFFDAGYNSEIEILGFDSRHPCPAAVEGIDELCRRLRNCRTFGPQLMRAAGAAAYSGMRPAYC